MSFDPLENEREWRRHIMGKLDLIESRLINKIDEIESEQVKISNEVTRIKTWLWIWRGIGSGILGGLLVWIKEYLK